VPLTFLVPAFLVGLAALAIPIVIHLTRKQRDRVMPFPSLMFLERVPYRAESRRRIHHWFLLLVRGLAVALLVLAFARPFLTDDDVLGVTGAGPTERVVVLDRSYSMAIGDRWERGRAAAAEVASGMGPLDRVSLVLFDLGADASVRSSSDPARLRQALDTARTSHRATRFGPALKLAQTILEESELPGRELVLVSDLQRSGWTGQEGITLPPGATVRTVRVGEAPPANTAVAGVGLARDLFEGRERVTPTARLTRIGGEGPLDVEVVLEVDGRELQRRRVTLPAAGAAPVSFEPFTLTERHTRGTVRVDDDELPHDNRHHFVLSPGRATGVLVLDPPGRGAEPSLYLAGALRISADQGFRVQVSGGAVPALDALAAYRVVVLNGRPFPRGAEGTRLRRFVEEGGGLILVAGERGGWPADAADLFAGTMGAVVDRDEDRGGRLGHVDYDHPVFELFRGPRRGDFSAARFFRARHWQIPPDVFAGDSVILAARFDDGSPALVERRVGAGRVLIWASTLDAFWTDLALQPVFLPFMHELVRYASGRTDVLDAFVAGQVLDVTDARAMETAGLGEVVEAIEAAQERVVLTPGGGDRPLPVGEASHFLELAESGFYEIRPPGRSEVRPVAVAVNVDPAEAELDPLDPQEVEAAILAGGDGGPLPPGEASRAQELQREDREKRQGLWRWLLVAAFGLLALETILSNRLSRVAGRRPKHVEATG
jgi:hypothetical protein